MDCEEDSVYQVYATILVPRTRLQESIQNPETYNIQLPSSITDIRATVRNNTHIIKPINPDDSPGIYTPSAIIKGYIRTRDVVVTDDGEITHKQLSDITDKNSRWTDTEDREIKSVEYIKYSGSGDSVIVHNHLRGEMFDLLCELTRIAVAGYVSGIRLRDGQLTAVRYDHGYVDRNIELAIEKSGTASNRPAGESDADVVPVNSPRG